MSSESENEDALTIEMKAYPQFAISMKVGGEGSTFIFKEYSQRQGLIDELETGMKIQDDIEYFTFDVPACPECVKSSMVTQHSCSDHEEE